MRKVKYQDTGEYGTSDVGYKADNGKYYSCAEAYEKILRDKQLYKNIYEELQDILGINEADPVPPVILKAINKYKNRYDVVAEILAQNKAMVRESIKSKEIVNPFHQSKYIQAVIENNYNQIKSDIDELNAVRHERNIEAPTDISALGHKSKNKDVTKLVGGFRWT